MRQRPHTRVFETVAAALGVQRLRPRLHSTNTWQRGCPELIPGLETKGFWYSSRHPVLDERLSWVRDLEAAFEVIRAEVLALRTSDGSATGFQQYRTPKWALPSRPGSALPTEVRRCVVCLLLHVRLTLMFKTWSLLLLCARAPPRSLLPLLARVLSVPLP